jgi:galactokinase
MAVTVDILLAVSIKPSSGTPKIRISNVDSKKFEKREFEVPRQGDISIDATEHEWTNYFKAGLKGASKLLQEKNSDFSLPSMDILVDGTVPSGGGLSSSAAFVCASALAVMKANGEHDVDKTKLVELAMVAERAVGVNSGG